MADVVARATQPALAAIKLAWWREQLEALDSGPPPAEPRLRAAAEHLLPRGIKGADLAVFEMGWASLLDESRFDPAPILFRGAKLFEAGAALLGAEYFLLTNAGGVYSAMSSARLGYEPPSGFVIPLLTILQDNRVPEALRPLTCLTCLAARDFKHGRPFEAEGGKWRAVSVLAHRWTGRITGR